MLWVNTLILFFISKQHLCWGGGEVRFYKPQNGKKLLLLFFFFALLNLFAKTFRSAVRGQFQTGF